VSTLSTPTRRYDYVEELTQYLYKNNMIKYIEVYVQKVNPARTPKVVGALLDHDCAEDIVKKLVMTVGPYCPCEQLVEECETRNRLKLVLPWLEARYNEGNQDSHLHDALAKIYIDTGRDPEKFLEYIDTGRDPEKFLESNRSCATTHPTPVLTTHPDASVCAGTTTRV
jgi:hypothetical protein